MNPQKFFGKFGILLFLIVLGIVFTILNKSFFTGSNIINIFRQVSMLGIVAIGMTFIMITGGVDLSVGSMGALTGVITAVLMVKGLVHPVIAVILGLLLGTLLGLINGVIIVQLKIPPLIATLGTFTIFRGFCYVITKGLPIFGFPRQFSVIGEGYLWIIPIPVLIFIIIFILGYLLLHRTYIGRYIFAIGGNEEAARLSGINIKGIKLLVFTIGGFLSGVTGIIMVSRLGSGQPSVLTGFELTVITAVVLGGVSFTGGEGNMFGMLIGVLILGVLANGLIMINVDMYWQWVVNGAVLITAVALDKVSKGKSGSMRTLVTLKNSDIKK